MKTISLLKVGFNFVLATILALFVSAVAPGAALFVGLATFATSFIPGLTPVGVLSMAVQTEAWTQDIEDNLFKGNEFINMSVNDDSIANNKTVHVPQAGSEPTVVKNRAVFPATATQRTDTTLDYDLDSWTTDPVQVQNADEVQTSYNKRMSIMGEHIAKLNETMGDETAFNWAATADADLVLRTTGDLSSDNLPHATATGQRRKVTPADIARMAAKLDKDLVPKEGRYLLMPTDMYFELFGEESLVRKDFVDRTAIPNAVINILYGFKIMSRASVVLYDNAAAGVKQAVGAVENATDCNAIIGWSQFHVRKAVESVRAFTDDQNPLYYGDVLSAEVIFGSSKSRSDNKGIVSLAQADA